MKKAIYILLTIFLALMLSFILHGLFELVFIKYAISNEKEIVGTYFFGVGWCALPAWVQYTLPFFGIVGGYFLGQYWWKVVYVQRKHWWFRWQDKKVRKWG